MKALEHLRLQETRKLKFSIEGGGCDLYIIEISGVDQNQTPFRSTVYSPVLAEYDDGYTIESGQIEMEVGRAGSFEFKMPYTNNAIALLDMSEQAGGVLGRTITVWDDDIIVFHGRPLMIERDFHNSITVTCEGAYGWLSDILIPPFTFDSDTASSMGYSYNYEGYTRYLLDKYNETLDGLDSSVNGVAQMRHIYYGNISSSNLDGSIVSEDYKSVQELLEEMAEKNPGTVDLIVETSEDANHNFVCTLSGGHVPASAAEMDALPRIEFGTNLTDFNRFEDGTDIYTRVIPFGKEDDEGNKLTIAGSQYSGGLIYIDATDGNASHIKDYGLRMIVADYSDIETADELYLKARDEYCRSNLKGRAIPAREMSFSAVDMTKLGIDMEHIRLGYEVMVVTVPHGVSFHYRCTKFSLNLLAPANDSYGVSSDNIMASVTGGKAYAASTRAVAERANKNSEKNATTITRVSESLADDYSNQSTYSVGDLVLYKNRLYQANTDITTAEDWDNTKWDYIDLKDLVSRMSGSIASEYDPTKSYTKGDLVVYKNRLYQASANMSPGSWDSSKWILFDLGSIAEKSWTYLGPLTSSDDLNQLHDAETRGYYFWPTSSIPDNAPTATSGVVLVFPAAVGRSQVALSDSKIFWRTWDRSNQTYGSWATVPTDVSGSVSSLETTVGLLSGQITTLETDVDNLSFGGKDPTINIPASFTYWYPSAGSGPADMPGNSYTYARASNLSGFDNSDFTLETGRSYYVICFIGMADQSNANRMYVIYGYAPTPMVWIGHSGNAGANVLWTQIK